MMTAKGSQDPRGCSTNAAGGETGGEEGDSVVTVARGANKTRTPAALGHRLSMALANVTLRPADPIDVVSRQKKLRTTSVQF